MFLVVDEAGDVTPVKLEQYRHIRPVFIAPDHLDSLHFIQSSPFHLVGKVHIYAEQGETTDLAILSKSVL